jgi:hypothetical protein
MVLQHTLFALSGFLCLAWSDTALHRAIKSTKVMLQISDIRDGVVSLSSKRMACGNRDHIRTYILGMDGSCPSDDEIEPKVRDHTQVAPWKENVENAQAHKVHITSQTSLKGIEHGIA